MSDEERELTAEEKVVKLEEILSEIMAQAQRKLGNVVAGPDAEGFYRIKTGAEETLLKVNPELNLRERLAVDTEVIYLPGMIVGIVPEELKPELEDLEFTRIGWDEIRGLGSQVEIIRGTIEGPLQNPEIYAEFGMPPIKGIALYGPPGTGKTKIAKAIASTVLGETFTPDKESFVYLKGGELLSKWVGEAEGNIKNIFDTCRSYIKKTGKPSIIFIDEAEAIVPVRGSRQSSDVDTTIVPTFLAEMDGINEHNPFVILATNHINNIDPAVLRPGRIDLKVEITRPTLEDSVDILDFYLDRTKLAMDKTELISYIIEFIQSDDVFKKKVSGAELEGIVKKATMMAINRLIKDKKSKERGVTLVDLEETLALV